MLRDGAHGDLFRPVDFCEGVFGRLPHIDKTQTFARFQFGLSTGRRDLKWNITQCLDFSTLAADRNPASGTVRHMPCYTQVLNRHFPAARRGAKPMIISLHTAM